MQGQTASYVLTTLVTAPASTGLTSLANIKDDLELDSEDDENDEWLTRIIAQTSGQIARYCNRVFGLATWQDEFRPQRGVWSEGTKAADNPLVLRRWPVVLPAPVLFTGNTYGNTTIDTLSTATGLAVGQLVSGPGIPLGATIATLNVGGNSLTLSLPTTATASAQPFSTGISVVETIAGVATGLTLGTDFEADTGSRVSGDEGASRLFRLNQQGNPRTWPAAMIQVVYQAGYALPNDSSPNLPEELEQACCLLIAARFTARGRDPMLVERTQGGTLGTERFWVGGTPGQVGMFPPEVTSLLDLYRVPVIA
jgi:hypothetical protein